MQDRWVKCKQSGYCLEITPFEFSHDAVRHGCIHQRVEVAMVSSYDLFSSESPCSRLCVQRLSFGVGYLSIFQGTIQHVEIGGRPLIRAFDWIESGDEPRKEREIT
jgi:hypothetical protein